MTRDEAITRIREALGFNESLQASTIVNALKDAQGSLEREPELPWFLRTEIASISTTANEERIALPDDFLLMPETQDDGLWRFDSGADTKWVRLSRDHLGFLRHKYRSTDPAKPTHFAVDKDYFRLFPEPDDVYTIKMIYLASDTVLDTNIENQWLKWFPWLLIAMALQQVVGSTRDAAWVEQWQSREQAERARLAMFSTAREMMDMPLQMGGPHV